MNHPFMESAERESSCEASGGIYFRRVGPLDSSDSARAKFGMQITAGFAVFCKRVEFSCFDAVAHVRIRLRCWNTGDLVAVVILAFVFSTANDLFVAEFYATISSKLCASRNIKMISIFRDITDFVLKS